MRWEKEGKNYLLTEFFVCRSPSDFGFGIQDLGLELDNNNQEFSFSHFYLFVSYRMHLAQIRHNILINPLVLAVFRLSLIPNKIEKRKLNIKVFVF